MFLENKIILRMTPIELVTRRWGVSGLKIFIEHIITSNHPQKNIEKMHTYTNEQKTYRSLYITCLIMVC